MTPTEQQYNEVSCDPNDPVIKGAARILGQDLMTKLGPEKAISILAVALGGAMISILHMDVPLPEVNIATIKALLADLERNVLDHVPCAEAIGKELTGGKVH